MNAQNMIGMVVVTHGKLAIEFVSAMEHVAGKQVAVRSICIAPDEDMEACRISIQQAIREVETGAGVVVLTDMFGGTPSNLAISMMEPGKVEVVAGINLPMLVKLAMLRTTTPLKEAVEAAQVAGRKYINIASNLLSEKSSSQKAS